MVEMRTTEGGRPYEAFANIETFLRLGDSSKNHPAATRHPSTGGEFGLGRLGGAEDGGRKTRDERTRAGRQRKTGGRFICLARKTNEPSPCLPRLPSPVLRPPSLRPLSSMSS